MLSDISKRLEAVNTLLGRHQQCNRFMFNDALPLSLFYRDFNDTNTLVKEAGLLFREDAEQLLEFSSSLLSEADKYQSLDRTPLQAVDFEDLFEEHLKPFELRYEEAKTAATELWRKYSAKSNRLDFLPWGSEEYKSLDVECSAIKAEYDEAHARVNLLYQGVAAGT